MVEGISSPTDLVEFDKDTLQQVADNLRHPGGRVSNPDGGGGTIPTPVSVFGAKSQKRLLVISDLVHYYYMVGRDVTAANVCYTQVGKNFETQWKALKARKDGDVPNVPNGTGFYLVRGAVILVIIVVF